MEGDLESRLKYKKDDADDWTKVEDKVLRKKIQNRLAKRKNRDDAKRQKRQKGLPSEPTTDEASQSPENNPSGSGLDEGDAQISVLGKQFSLKKVAAETAEIDPRVQTYLGLSGLAEHQFLQLPHYSLFRAMVRNADMLGLNPFLFYDDDALSPWTDANPFAIAAPYTTSKPHTLCPTPVQLSTPHHPYLDVIAVPTMRDNLILAGLSDEQEDSVCRDLHSESFTVWGSQCWNAMCAYSLSTSPDAVLLMREKAWEVSQSFVDKWWWLLGDETIFQSNFWRAERGEPPLKVPAPELSEVLEEVP